MNSNQINPEFIKNAGRTLKRIGSISLISIIISIVFFAAYTSLIESKDFKALEIITIGFSILITVFCIINILLIINAGELLISSVKTENIELQIDQQTKLKITQDISEYGGALLNLENGKKIAVTVINDNKMTWNLALTRPDIANKYNQFKGWRLPNNIELQCIYSNKLNLGNFKNYNYWSSEAFNEDMAFYLNMQNGELSHLNKKAYEFFVCIVRDI